MCRLPETSLTFTKLPTTMLAHMVFQCVKMLNYFPTARSISSTICPITLLTGETLNIKKTSAFLLVPTAKSTSKTPHATVWMHTLKLPSALDPPKIFRGSITSCLSPVVILLPDILGLSSLWHNLLLTQSTILEKTNLLLLPYLIARASLLETHIWSQEWMRLNQMTQSIGRKGFQSCPFWDEETTL